MNRVLLQTLLVVCAAASTVAVPRTARAAQTQSIQITGHALRPLWPREAQGVVGTYRLSDGRSLTLLQRRGAVWAQIDREPGVRLLASASTASTTGWRLQAPDGRMQVSFDLDMNGFVQTLTLAQDRGPARDDVALAPSALRP